MRRAILAALLCVLLLCGCGGASDTRQQPGQTITVITEKDGLAAQGVAADPVTRSAPAEANAETYILNRSSVKFSPPHLRLGGEDQRRKPHRVDRRP